jgi:hypothetical protein
VRNKRYTLAVRRLEDGDTASSVLVEFLGVLEGLDPAVKAVYLDREFPRESPTGRPFRAVITDRDRPLGEWPLRRVGG